MKSRASDCCHADTVRRPFRYFLSFFSLSWTNRNIGLAQRRAASSSYLYTELSEQEGATVTAHKSATAAHSVQFSRPSVVFPPPSFNTVFMLREREREREREKNLLEGIIPVNAIRA